MPTRSPLLLLLLLATLAGCSEPGGPPSAPPQPPPPPTGAVARLAFVRDTFAVMQQGSLQLRAVGYDSGGTEIPDLVVAYSVSGNAVTATGAGMVLGVSPGVGTVEARVGQVSASATLEVFGHPDGILLGDTPLGSRPFGVAVSREGVVYVTQLDNQRVARLDTSLTVIDSIDVGATPTGVTFAPNGRTAYVANQHSRSVGVIDVASGSQARTIAVAADPFVPFVSPDGSRIFITSNMGMVYIAEAETGAVIDSILLAHAPNGFALHPDGARVYVSTFVGGTVSEMSVASGAVLRTFTPGGTPQDMVVSPDGRELYVANEAGWVDVYDLETGMPAAQVPLAGGAFGMALSPDLEHLYVSEPGSGLVQVVHAPARSVVGTINVGGVPRRVAFTRHGGIAVIPNEQGYVSFVR